MIAYRFHSLEADGPWISPPFPPANERHIMQGVIAGYIMGRPRWAEDLSGKFLYGLDAKGKQMTAPPAPPPPPTSPRRRGKNKPKATHHSTMRTEGETESFASLHRRTAREIDRGLMNRELAKIWDATHVVAAGAKIYTYGSEAAARAFAHGLPRFAEGKPLKVRSITVREQHDLAKHKKQAYGNP
jgi:hypothetical protein